MTRIAESRKAIAQFLTAVGTWATAVVVSEPTAITSSEWVVLLGGAIGAFLVWFTPNDNTTVDIAEALLPYDPEHTTPG